VRYRREVNEKTGEQLRGVSEKVGRSVPLWPTQGWVGLILVAVCWPLNWTLPGVRTAYLFFPLWLGYVLVVDALVQLRTGSSTWVRSRKDFVLLFFISAPVWWLFELINLRTGNWEYVGRELFSPLQFNLLCTISFSVVVPAVFETAEVMRSFGWIERFVSLSVCRPRSGGTGHAVGDAGLAENFLSVCMDFAGFHFGADQLLDGPAAFSGEATRGRLAHRDLAVTWRAGVRLLLGDVELFLVSQVGLSHAGHGVLARL